MTEPLLLSALLASLFALPLAALAIVRRQTDGWMYACIAALGPISTFAVGGGLGLLSAASFRRGYLRDTPARSVDVAGMFTVLHEHYPELEPAARIALWTGGIAICAAFFAVFVIAWRSPGARRWVMVGLSAVASGMCIMTWRVAHLSERALSDAIDDGVRIALIQEIEQGCETLESTFAVAQHANLSLDLEYPRARPLAHKCVDRQIAQLDDPYAKNLARARVELSRATGQPPIPETPAAQLLVTSAFPIDSAQRAELERRAAGERSR